MDEWFLEEREAALLVEWEETASLLSEPPKKKRVKQKPNYFPSLLQSMLADKSAVHIEDSYFIITRKAELGAALRRLGTDGHSPKVETFLRNMRGYGFVSVKRRGDKCFEKYKHHSIYDLNLDTIQRIERIKPMAIRASTHP